MEATFMKAFGVISTTALLLLFGATVPAFAQEEHHEQEAKPEKQEQAKPAQEEKQAKPAKQEEQAKPAKQQEQAKPAKEEKQAKSEKQQPEAKPAKQQEEAKPAKQEKQAKTEKQEPQSKPAKQEKQAKQEEGKGGGQQHAQRSEAEQQHQRSEPALRLSSRGNGRIPDDKYRANFGEGHRFRIDEPVMVGGFSRFQYGGFWFGFVQPWPAEWYYTDDVYVVLVDGGYYLCNPYYPDDRVSISVVL
jgi:primosomal protein N'